MGNYHSNLEMARALLAAKADVKKANRLGLTPLLQACRLGYSPIIELLLNAGADPNAASPQGETPLLAASGSGDVEPVKLLIARGVDVNAKESGENQTALMWAAGAGHVQVIQTLLKAGANPNLAAKTASLSREKLGDQGRDWVVHPTGGLTALSLAAREGRLDAAKALLEGGARVNQANSEGVSALIIAVINDQLDLAAMLLEKDASPNDGSLYELVQLHNRHVIETNHDATRPLLIHQNKIGPLDLMALMLERGADPLKPATHTLYFAGAGGGGSAGLVNPANQSAFARALQAQDSTAVQVLLRKVPHPSVPIDGGLPLTLAMGGGARGFAGFGVPPSPYRFASDRTTAATMKTLFDAGADVNAANAAGDTALHTAAQNGDAAVIQLLAGHGAKFDIKDKAGLKFRRSRPVAIGHRGWNARGCVGRSGGWFRDRWTCRTENCLDHAARSVCGIADRKTIDLRFRPGPRIVRHVRGPPYSARRQSERLPDDGDYHGNRTEHAVSNARESCGG